MIKPPILKVYSEIEGGKNPLKAVREVLRMSQQEFANALGVAVSSVSRWERGVSPMTLTISQMQQFDILLKKLNMTIHDLPQDSVETTQES